MRISPPRNCFDQGDFGLDFAGVFDVIFQKFLRAHPHCLLLTADENRRVFGWFLLFDFCLGVICFGCHE